MPAPPDIGDTGTCERIQAYACKPDLLALVGDSGGTGSGSLRIEVLATRLNRLEVLVQLVQQRDGGRDVDLGDLFL